MSMKEKKLWRLLSIVLVMSMLVACGNAGGSKKDDGTEGGEGSNEEGYTIHYLTARNKDEGTIKSITKVAELYKEEHPNFDLEIESVSDRTAYLQKLKILASSDELPEWFDSDADSFFGNLIEEGKVADIDKVYEDLNVTDQVYENARNYQRTSDGFLGLICWQGNTEYFWYNKKCFEKAGIDKAPETFDEFMEVCKKLKDSEITPLSLAGAQSWPILRYLAMKPFRRTGNEFIEAAKIGEESFSSEVGLEAANFVVELAPYLQTGWSTADIPTSVGLVTSSDAAMVYMGTWGLSYFLDEDGNLKEDMGYFTLPSLGADDVTAPNDYWAHAGMGTAIRKDALDENMMDFLKFVYENYADISLYEFDTIPGMKATVRDDLPEIYKEMMDNYSKVQNYAYCWDVRIDSASNEILVRETPSLATGDITPEEWAKRMDEAIKQNVK